jgi:hypothetical protein
MKQDMQSSRSRMVSRSTASGSGETQTSTVGAALWIINPRSWDCPACHGRLVEAISGEDFAMLNVECEHCKVHILSFTTRCTAGEFALDGGEDALD